MLQLILNVSTVFADQPNPIIIINNLLFFVLGSISVDSYDASTSVETSSSSVQTPNFLSSGTPRKRVLRHRLTNALNTVTELKNQLQHTTTIEYCMQVCKQHLPPSIFLIVENNFQNKDKSQRGQRYSKQIKQFALTIYFISPGVFNFLQKSLSLPTVRTLRRVTEQYDLQPGLNDFLFDFLEFKISTFKPEALDCFLCADEMSLKTNLFYNVSKDQIIGFNQSGAFRTYEPAKYVLVLMIRGINSNWKQPIAYYLVSNSCSGTDLNLIIFSTIRRLRSIKLNVKSFITDQGSNFIKFSNSNHVTPEEPFFEVDGEKVIYIFDPPHLLKSTRNMFFKHMIEINDEVVDKKYLDIFYNYDNKCNLRMAPKLTYFHIHPGPFDKMKVRLAAQVFSASVAAGMSTALNCGLLPVDAQSTIYFINNMDKLFDIFNSTDIPNGKIYNQPFTNTAPQTDHLSKMTEMFKNMKFINKIDKSDVTKRTNFINGWLVSISGLRMLWHSLNPTNKPGFSICTGRLNQDSQENLFGTFRQQHGNNTNPTPVQFIQSFKKIFCLQYFKHSPGANCIEDLDQVLGHMNDKPNNKIMNVLAPEEKHIFKFKSLQVGTVDYRKLNIPEANAYTYVCGYLMKKCLEIHSCQVCVDYANCQKTINKSFLLSFFKSYSSNNDSNFGKLLMPHNDFYNYILKLENIFIEQFPIIAIRDNVGYLLNDFLCNVRFNHPCELFNKQFLMKLFIRFRIFSSVKFLNRPMLSETKRKNRKLSILKHL